MTVILKYAPFLWAAGSMIATFAVAPMIGNRAMKATRGAWWAKLVRPILYFLGGALWASVYVWFFIPCQ